MKEKMKRIISLSMLLQCAICSSCDGRWLIR